ncbi:MAG: methylmalonyl-CoA mutase [Acidobacteriota bacterium]
MSRGGKEDGRERLRRSLEQWRRTVRRRALEKLPERRPRFTTASGLEVPPLPTALDLDEAFDLTELGFPGEYPFTRGIQATMYRARPWTMRQYAGFGSAEESNRRYRYLLQQGTTGLSVAFDLPTQMGYDSDHPMAGGEVGRVGVAIDSLADMEILFRAIPLARVSTSMTINATAAILVCLYVAVARKQGVDPAALRGTVQNDILKEYAARGTFIYPPGPSLRLATDAITYCADRLPAWNPISISGYHIREAGATAVQEVAFTLANGSAYAEHLKARGVPPDRFGRRLSFFFAAHSDFLEEIAKFRAARRLWARLMKERLGAREPESMKLRFHAQTAGSTLTVQQPENNLARVTLQALAAVLGGAQSLHTNSMDEALGLPTEKAARLALRTQQILAHESGVADWVDPMGGSYAVERLTGQIEAAALEILERIDKMGGAVAALKAGQVQRDIAESAYRTQKALDADEKVLVGVNRFRTSGSSSPVSRQEIDPDLERRQAERTRSVRAGRDAARLEKALERIQETARGEGNLLEPILEAVEAYATLGEISDVLGRVFGRHQEITAGV